MSAWRLIVCALLHFGILAYLVLVPLACLLTAPRGASAADLIRLGLRYSGWFVLAFAFLAFTSVAASGFGVGAARRRHRRAIGPDAFASEQALSRAAAIASSIADPEVRGAASRVAALPWFHDEAAGQAMSRDLVALLDTAGAALATAPPDKLPAIRQRTLLALGHLEHAVADLAAERAAADDTRAQATALYVEQRYRELDFAIKPD